MDSLIYRPWVGSFCIASPWRCRGDLSQQEFPSGVETSACSPRTQHQRVVFPALWGDSQGSGCGEALPGAYTCKGSTWPSTINNPGSSSAPEFFAVIWHRLLTLFLLRSLPAEKPWNVFNLAPEHLPCGTGVAEEYEIASLNFMSWDCSFMRFL